MGQADNYFGSESEGKDHLHGQTLRDATSGVVIVAHDEDTSNLRAALIAEGFAVDEVRSPYTSKQRHYSAIMRCLVNHGNAWRIAARRDLPTIVVEADFVPVRGFGMLPVPVPFEKRESSLAYLYAVGPEIWDLTNGHFARGHGGGAVALLIPRSVALLLEDFFNDELSANPDGVYRPWDSGMGYWLLKRGIESYIPYRHYGEHGGLGNPEHSTFGQGRLHRADALAGTLAFKPAYARDSDLKFWRARTRARLWGTLRLLSGRYLKPHDFRRAAKRWQTIRFTVGRLVTSSTGDDHSRSAILPPKEKAHHA